MSDPSPDRLLLEFIEGLPATIRHDLWDAIALAFEKRARNLDESALPEVVREIIQPQEDWLMRQRVILVTGLLDHLMNTVPLEADYWYEGPNRSVIGSVVTPIVRLHYRQAQARWYELRCGPLSPEALAIFS
ncbi:MAG: hypothetical protein HY852_24845 [Bradyrhizobium sp.]|uniref:hypothetical protein n=1 Tax=Bradyrhizobium sp. TaxID=376 RepID=UPI0025C6E484|nr:hypothetical protein [Bradyrhizobium sp.]MBI5265035.1 hypothetical protein [Bradyrhizobium sp.]